MCHVPAEQPSGLLVGFQISDGSGAGGSDPLSSCSKASQTATGGRASL